MDNKVSVFDHPPSPEDLSEVLAQYNRDDPRSKLYERTLARPQIPIGKILLFLITTVGVCIAVHSVASYVFVIDLWASLCTVATALLIGAVFAKQILITLVKMYQALAPVKIRCRCRYEPSCSEYMIQALEKYGVLVGFAKGFWRWRRCKPPNGGIDFP